MQSDSPLFDKTHRNRFADKLAALLKIAKALQPIDESTDRDALQTAIPRLFRRAAMVVGVYGFGLEAQRIDLLLSARRPTLLQTRNGKTIDLVNELIHLLEDLLFLAADDTGKLEPLIAPKAVAPAPAKTPVAASPKPSKKPGKPARR
jgi:hypothetical protein